MIQLNNDMEHHYDIELNKASHYDMQHDNVTHYDMQHDGNTLYDLVVPTITITRSGGADVLA